MIGALKDDVDAYTPGFPQTVQVFPNQSGTSDARVSDGLSMPQQPAAPIVQLPLTRSNPLLFAIDNLRTPYFQHFNFTVQRELMANTVLEAGYVGTRGVKLIMAVDFNQPRIFGDFLQSFQQLQAFQANGTAVPAGNTLVRIFGSPATSISRLGASNFQLGAVGTAANNLDLGFYPLYQAAGRKCQDSFRGRRHVCFHSCKGRTGSVHRTVPVAESCFVANTGDGTRLCNPTILALRRNIAPG